MVVLDFQLLALQALVLVLLLKLLVLQHQLSAVPLHLVNLPQELLVLLFAAEELVFVGQCGLLDVCESTLARVSKSD